MSIYVTYICQSTFSGLSTAVVINFNASHGHHRLSFPLVGCLQRTRVVDARSLCSCAEHIVMYLQSFVIMHSHMNQARFVRFFSKFLSRRHLVRDIINGLTTAANVLGIDVANRLLHFLKRTHNSCLSTSLLIFLSPISTTRAIML